MIDSIRFCARTVDSHCRRRFHFISVQGRHLFKKTTFTGSPLPRAWLEPPCAAHSGVSRLMGLHYRSSHRRPFAIPANVFGGASGAQSQEAPPPVSIHDAVVRTMKRVK